VRPFSSRPPKPSHLHKSREILESSRRTGRERGKRKGPLLRALAKEGEWASRKSGGLHGGKRPKKGAPNGLRHSKGNGRKTIPNASTNPKLVKKKEKCLKKGGKESSSPKVHIDGGD